MAMIQRIIYVVIFAQCLLGLITAELQAQASPFDSEMSAEAARIKERVDGITDRSLYICGEAIRFRVQVHISGLPDGGEWSKILYVELLSAGGVSQAQGKYKIQEHAATGELRIPEGLLTGTYFLRFYTRWMRNWYPAIYSYIPLRIINPLTAELSENGPGEIGEIMLDPHSKTEGKLAFSTQSSTFSRGDTIRMSLSHEGEDPGERITACISVVPAVARSLEPLQLANPYDGEDFQLSYLPDLIGITLSGKVLDPDNEDQSHADSRVHFTLLGEQSTYSVARSDAYGNFALTLPWREGRLEFFVQSEHAGKNDLELRIDQDFDPRVLPLEAPDFTLTREERQMLTLMARNLQLSGIFHERSTENDAAATRDGVPFYGRPSFSLDMDKYVLLPTLEEVFINLVPGVTPLIRRNRTELLIDSDNPGISLFPPLIMIDQVPLFSMEQFLAVPPGKISHIDVVSDVYLKGDLRFGGIINLRSREGNMAGIDLPDHSFFFDFEALYPQSVQVPEKMPETTCPNDRIPDTRNTLLWMPEVQIDGGETLSLSYVAPDYPGEYVVLFRGWNEQGQRVSAETIISVE